MAILNKQVLDCLKELQQLSSELIHTASMPDRTDLLNKIRVKLDFFRETFSEDESNFDRKLLAWRQAETRYHRSQRLVDLGAPLLILNLEFVWLSVMLDHMRMVSLGIEPVFTQEQQEELAELRELEKGM